MQSFLVFTVASIFFRSSPIATTERALDWGYSAGEISVRMSDRTRANYHDHGTEGQIKTSSHAMEGVAAGGAVGTIVGATVATILTTAAGITLPILGGLIVAGPIVAALAGGGAAQWRAEPLADWSGSASLNPTPKPMRKLSKRVKSSLVCIPIPGADAKAIRQYFEEQEADNIVSA